MNVDTARSGHQCVRQLMHEHGHEQQQRRDEPEPVRAVQGTYNALLDVKKLTDPTSTGCARGTRRWAAAREDFSRGFATPIARPYPRERIAQDDRCS
jgi:hypothetical protein